MRPECPTNDWRGKSCWLRPRESGPEVIQGPGGVNTSPALVWRKQKYEIAVDRELFRVFLGLLSSRASAEEKRVIT